jgi:hypothetical protein
MQGISTLATIISVFSFSLTCVVVLYPTLSRFKSRWKGVAFYGGISVGALLVAALTALDPALSDQEWSWVDWTVLGLGVGGGLAMMLKRLGWLRKKQADAPAVQARGEGSVNKKISGRGKKPLR